MIIIIMLIMILLESSGNCTVEPIQTWMIIIITMIIMILLESSSNCTEAYTDLDDNNYNDNNDTSRENW